MNVNMDDNTKRFLSKTLAYMLRHNQKLTLHKGGFILLDDLKVRHSISLRALSSRFFFFANVYLTLL